MKARINGTGMLRGASARLSADGRTLTLTTVSPGKSVSEIAAMLEGEAKIELMDGLSVTAVYKSDALAAIHMEMRGGAPVVTAMLRVQRIGEDEADRLRGEIERLTSLNDRQAAALSAQEERIKAQEAALEAMDTAVRTAQSAAEAAQSAIRAIEEGIEDA